MRRRIYSLYLDNLIRTEVAAELKAMGATVTYVSMSDGLDAIMPTLEALHGLAPGTLTTDLLNPPQQGLLRRHPSDGAGPRLVRFLCAGAC